MGVFRIIYPHLPGDFFSNLYLDKGSFKGVPHRTVHEEVLNNVNTVLDATKYPFYIDYIDKIGILGVQFDITDAVKKDTLSKQLQAELEKCKNN